jgi:hypothetical protein
MKKYLMACVILVGSVLTGCSAGYVATRPADVEYSRPAAPGTGYVWIGGEWEWGGGTYHWHEGTWQQPREGRTWKSGYWESGDRGYRWHNGEWQK